MYVQNQKKRERERKKGENWIFSTFLLNNPLSVSDNECG